VKNIFKQLARLNENIERLIAILEKGFEAQNIEININGTEVRTNNMSLLDFLRLFNQASDPGLHEHS